MQTENSIIRNFQESARIKSLYASSVDLRERSEAALERLELTRTPTGVIRIFSDVESRWSAHHFNEELVVRFKAGSPYGRPDRPAINSRQYSEFDNKYIIKLIESECFNSDLDTLVFFASMAKTTGLAEIAKIANQKNLRSICVAPESNPDLLKFSDFPFSLPNASRPILACMQTLLLHSFCEKFEPEYDPDLHSFSVLAKASAELDLLISREKSLISLVSEARGNLARRIANGASLFLAGNGGSTCDANLLASYLREPGVLQKHFEIFDLHSSDTLLCAYNDNHSPFERQIVANGRKGDVLLIYSTSGNSQNIIDAVNAAKGRGLYTIGLLGKGGGKLAPICDVSIIVPSDETSRVQEAHALIGPMLFL